jgi:ligand-binding sensor domain-containing protein
MAVSHEKTHFRPWIILGVIISVIVIITVIFATQTKKYPPPPAGWQIIRPSYTILAFAEQPDTIWAGGADGLFVINKHTLDIIESKQGGFPTVKYIRDLCVDRHGGLWIAHNNGLTLYQNGEQRTYTDRDGLPKGYCAAVIEDHEGNIWIGTETGIARFDGQRWHDLTIDSGFGIIPVTTIFEDSNNVFWFGSDSVNNTGLMRYDGSKWSSFPVAEGLIVHNTICDIFEDMDGNLWVASGLGSSGGATCIMESGVVTFTMDTGLMGPRVRSLFQDRLGRIWFASEFEGSAIWDGEKWYSVTPEQGFAGWEVMEMIEDSSGVLWLATENGITRIASVNDTISVLSSRE